MIPKIIHYVWLGGKPLPKIAEKCMKSWKKYCPDYEIKRWDESNLDLDYFPYVRQAYDEKKYAFASDVLRLQKLYEYGGIYLDIDVEIIKPIDELLKHKCFTGFESSKLINPGVIFGTEKENADLKNILDEYKLRDFKNGKDFNLKTICDTVTEYYEKFGLKREDKIQDLGNIFIYSSEYFSPKNLTTGVIYKTKNTYSIHHFFASWLKKSVRFKSKVLQFIKRLIGLERVEKMKQRKQRRKLSE